MIEYTTARSVQDLWQILALQTQNLPSCLDEQEMKKEGFVTVKHEPELLQAMNKPHPHILAKDRDRVVGFALVMDKQFGDKVPVLVPMFELIQQLEWKAQPIKNIPYFVMGQVCIDKSYRGQGIFSGLYQKLQEEMSSHFDLVITEIATRNTRSIRAHEKVGFQHLKRYKAAGEEWDMVVWDWRAQ